MEQKKTDAIAVVLVIVGAILLYAGLTYDIPSREFSFYSIKEYVGGDAYNGIIEASIRGGEIAGATITKAIYTCSGIIVMALGSIRAKRLGN